LDHRSNWRGGGRYPKSIGQGARVKNTTIHLNPSSPPTQDPSRPIPPIILLPLRPLATSAPSRSIPSSLQCSMSKSPLCVALCPLWLNPNSEVKMAFSLEYTTDCTDFTDFWEALCFTFRCGKPIP
jgi:hypothetical protein